MPKIPQKSVWDEEWKDLLEGVEVEEGTGPGFCECGHHRDNHVHWLRELWLKCEWCGCKKYTIKSNLEWLKELRKQQDKDKK